MAARRVLADEHTKFTILTTAPADTYPTAAELNAGIDASCLVYADDFSWTAADSESIAERALCEATAAASPGISNYTLGFTAWRFFDETTGQPDPTADALFQAVKVKGTELWGYTRRTGQRYDEPWVDGDECQLGGRFITDTPQVVAGGLTKYRIPGMPQAMDDFFEVGDNGSV